MNDCSESDVSQQCNSAPEHRTHLNVSQSLGLQLLSVLQSFRQQALLFDFTISVQDHSFPCHRCVLAASSDFFKAMFEVDMRERGDGSVTLTNQSPAEVASFLDFAYSGEVLITDTNVDMLFQIASFLQSSVLSKACSDFLVKTMNLSNCLSLLSLAEAYGSASLLQRAKDFVVENFYELSQKNEFLDMQTNVLETCLRSDSLNVPSEEDLVMSLLTWTQHQLQERQKLLPGLLSLTRLHHLPASALKTLFELDPLPSDKECLALLSKAQHIQSQYTGLMTDARPSTTRSYIYAHKTEENNEVCHTFCFSLESDQWKELRPEDGDISVPDPPGSHYTSYAEKMFVTGGCRGNCRRTIRLHVAEPYHDASDEVWCFCPVTRTCSPCSAMLRPRTMHTALTCLDRIYVIGGRTKGPTGEAPLLEVDYFNPLSQTWTSVSPLPTAIFYPETSSCGSVIYTLGSEVEVRDSFNPALDCFFRYDATEDQWTRLVAEFGQLFFHAALVKTVSINNTLHLCDLSTYKVYSFCPDSCVWNGEGSFESAGFNAGAVGTRDRIYILGGDYSPGEITDEVQVYHSGKSQWEEVAPMPKGLTEFHCQIISFNKYRDPWKDEA